MRTTRKSGLLTRRQKQLVGVVAELMSQNSGLNYDGLSMHPRILEVSGYRYPQQDLSTLLRKVGIKYGLNNPSRGEVIYEALARGDVQMRIRVPVPAKPQLHPLEMRVLECSAKVLVPKGGNFSGYLEEVARLMGWWEAESTRGQLRVNNYRIKIRDKFNAPNLETAVVSAFAVGILAPRKVFGTELPRTFVTITSSDSYRIATGYTAIGVYARSLTEEEKIVAEEFRTRIGLNGGLFWEEWIPEVASHLGKNRHSVLATVIKLARRFNVLNRGEMFYAVSTLLNEPVVISIPNKVEAEFNETEQDFIVAAANALLPARGYYHGLFKDIAAKVHISVLYAYDVGSGIRKKTGTANLAQAVTFCIAYGHISPSHLSTYSKMSPALEAIIAATRKVSSYANPVTSSSP